MLGEIGNFLAADLRTATPILLCALGLVFSSKAGIVNIGAEGMMLMGALMGVVGSWLTGSVWGGVLLAMLSGMLLSLLFAFLVLTARADQTFVGAILNMFALGLTTTLSLVIFGMNTTPPKISTFTPLNLPFLQNIPVLGTVLSQMLPTFLVFLAVPLAQFVMYRGNLGLKIRAVGENPLACDTLGISVQKIRYGTILFSGLMAGFAGAYMSLGSLSFFKENMVAGRGYMAVAAVVFGKYSPVGVMGATLVFGAGEALMYRLQAAGTGIPYQFMMMIPYLLTVLALCGLVGKSNSPATSGQPYVKE